MKHPNNRAERMKLKAQLDHKDRPAKMDVEVSLRELQNDTGIRENVPEL